MIVLCSDLCTLTIMGVLFVITFFTLLYCACTTILITVYWCRDKNNGKPNHFSSLPIQFSQVLDIDFHRSYAQITLYKAYEHNMLRKKVELGVSF